MATKTYSNGRISVEWTPDACIHSKECWKNMIEVFNPKNRPWINLDGANDEAILNQVAKCPSGALKGKKLQAEEQHSDVNSIKATCMQNGPLLIDANIEIVLSDGTVVLKEGKTAFCRCGHSANKPFCDGAHRNADFKG
jgi:uncharacterized Fe-S cluster protein YjdI